MGWPGAALATRYAEEVPARLASTGRCGAHKNSQAGTQKKYRPDWPTTDVMSHRQAADLPIS